MSDREERTDKRAETHACDLISRQAEIDALNSLQKFSLIDDNEYLHGVGVRLKFAIQKIEQLPSAQPERMKGKWKRAYLDHEAMGKRPSVLYCSICNQCIAYSTNFCPNCGADMREGRNNETD